MKLTNPKSIALATAGLLALLANAGTYTWIGGSTNDAVWNNPANWDPEGVPTGGDTARIVSGSDNVALTITFPAGFEISGGVLTIENWNVLTFSGVISGNGGLLLQNYGNATITGDNTFTGSFETTGSGQITIKKLANAGQPSSVGAGSGENALVKLNCGELSITDTCSTDRPIERNNGAAVRPSGTVTLNGSYTGQYFGRIDGTVVFNGLVDLAANSELKRTDFGTTKLTNPANGFTSKIIIASGTLRVASLADKGVASAAGAGTTLQFEQQQATTRSFFKYEGTTDAHCDRDIIVDPYNGAAYSDKRGLDFENVTAGTKVTFSGTISQLGTCSYPFFRVWGVGDGEYAGSLGGNFNFYKEGTGYWVLSGANAHAGKTVAAGGRLDITGSTPASSAVEVLTGATLGGTGRILGPLSVAGRSTLAAGTPASCGTLTAAAVALDSGATLSFRLGANASDAIAVEGNLAVDGIATVRAVAADGGTIPDGTYTILTFASSSLTPVSFLLELPGGEEGEIEVGTTDVKLHVGVRSDILVWKGDGVSNELTVPANWQGGAFDASMTLVFDDTGDATVPVHLSSDVSPAAVRLLADTSAYTFAGAGFAGTAPVVKTGAGGVTFANTNSFTGGYQATAGATVLDGVFSGSSILTIDTASFTENATGVISGSDIAVSFGPGGATLSGTNDFSGTMEFNARPATSSASYKLFEGAALGNVPSLDILLPNGSASLELAVAGTWTTEVPVTVRDGAARSQFTLNSGNSSGDHWLKGGVLGSGTGSVYPTMQFTVGTGSGSISLGAEGGTALSGFASVLRRGTRPVRYYGRVDLPAGSTILKNDFGLDEFYAPSNAVGTLEIQQGTLRICADDAFGTNTLVKMGKDSRQWGAGHDSKLDLNGHDLVLKGIGEQYVGQGGFRRIESEAPATLTIWSDDTDSTFGSSAVYADSVTRCGEIRYAVSLVKKGAATLTLSGTNTFTGTVSVEGGVLATASACALPATTALYLGKKDGSAGVVRLDVSQTVDSLYIDGIGRRSGVYGGPDSAAPADNRLACFAGTGVLTVLTGKAGGFIISIR